MQNRHNCPSFTFLQKQEHFKETIYFYLVTQTSLFKVKESVTLIWSSVEEQETHGKVIVCFIIPVECHFATNPISDYLETQPAWVWTELEHKEQGKTARI